MTGTFTAIGFSVTSGRLFCAGGNLESQSETRCQVPADAQLIEALGRWFSRLHLLLGLAGRGERKR